MFAPVTARPRLAGRTTSNQFFKQQQTAAQRKPRTRSQLAGEVMGTLSLGGTFPCVRLYHRAYVSASGRLAGGGVSSPSLSFLTAQSAAISGVPVASGGPGLPASFPGRPGPDLPPSEGGRNGPPLVYTRNNLPSAAGAASSGFAFSYVVPETGEILTLRQGHDCRFSLVKSPAEIRARRWQRLALVRGLLRGPGFDRGPGLWHRTCYCHHAPVPGVSDVEVWRKLLADQETPGHFRGVMTCGNVWTCDPCASKVSERRREELRSAIDQWQRQGGAVWLCTYTFSHGRWDVLRETLDALSRARKRMKEGREYQAIRETWGIAGTVLAMEITHGPRHGWHPHYHELVFLDGRNLDMAEFRRRMYAKWRAACLRSGLGEPSESRGFDVRGGEHAAAYVAKMGDDSRRWDLQDEMTKGHIKAAKGDNRSPGQLLDCILDPLSDENHRREARALWLDYAAAMKGRRQLVWSKGFKARFGLADLSDEELAARAEEEAVLIARIPLEDWAVIVRHKLQFSVLELAKAGPEAIENLIAAFRGGG